MSDSQIAAQLYTLRDFLKTPEDIAHTLARVRKLGYRAVQLSTLGPIDPKELAGILQGEGLVCCATHTPTDRLKNEPERVIDEHRLWDCRYTAIGGHTPTELVASDWTYFANYFNDTVRSFAGSGLSVGYHNHSHELAKFDGTTALQTLVTRLDPSVWFEIDTFWIVHGGGDPADWVRRIAQTPGRTPCVHLKDMGAKPDGSAFMMEVGEGNLNWPEVLRACRDADVQWYIVEQDVCYRDPFESLGISLRNLNDMGLK